jgi:hypothetical protein
MLRERSKTEHSFEEELELATKVKKEMAQQIRVHNNSMLTDELKEWAEKDTPA